MGWFPGYAIDVTTGMRLNMAFSENSWLAGENGDDMIWNPTSNMVSNTGDPLLGGMQFVYVFNSDASKFETFDNGAYLHEKLSNETASAYTDVWKKCMWVMEPLLAENGEWMATDVKVSARIKKPYREIDEDGPNDGFPMYQFGFDSPSVTGQSDRLVSVIDQINIVPNPYYAYSEYETGRRDNRVKITNVPERCEITIYNMQGALVRSFVKDDPLTSIDWDLKNHQNIPIAGGMYIIHIKIEVPDENGNLIPHEKVLKWFGVLRQPDLDNL
jgi:translation elongation factor EF-1beta